MDESYQPTEQDQKDLALLDNTTDWFKIAQNNVADLDELEAPISITDPLYSALEHEQELLSRKIYDLQAHNALVTAWANAQNWLSEHRGDKV